MAGKAGQRRPNKLLHDMRMVYRQAEDKDKDHQKPLRQMLKEDPKGFISQLGQLERGHRQNLSTGKQGQEVKPAPETEEVEDGGKKVGELYERLLGEV